MTPDWSNPLFSCLPPPLSVWHPVSSGCSLGPGHGLLRLSRLTSSLCRDFLFILYVSVRKSRLGLSWFSTRVCRLLPVHPRLSACPSQTLSDCDRHWGWTDFYLPSPVGERSPQARPHFSACILTTRHGSGTGRWIWRKNENNLGNLLTRAWNSACL